MDAWIETNVEDQKLLNKKSRSSWTRGLKLRIAVNYQGRSEVAFLVDAWIETYGAITGKHDDLVAFLVDAWIETDYNDKPQDMPSRRVPRGRVD